MTAAKAPARESTDWQPTACILCECNCGLEVELGGEDGRHFVRVRGDKRASGVAGLRLREAARASTTTRTGPTG